MSAASSELLALNDGRGLVWRDLRVGEFRGKDVRDLIQRLCTNDVLKPDAGSVIGNVFTNEKGRILDVTTMLLEADGLTAIGAAPAGQLVALVDRMTFREDVTGEDRTARLRVLSLVGHATTIPGKFLTTAEGRVIHGEVLGVPGVHYIGDALDVVHARLAGEGFTAVSAEIFNWWRVAHGVPAWPQEISPEHNPHEAALAPFIDWKKGCYVGQEVVARLDTYKKVQRRLVRLALSRAPEGETALFAGGEEAGRVSSVAVLPGAPFVAALAYVKEAAAALPHFEARDSAGVFSADLHRG